MIGIDTNVLVRYLTQDDAAQAWLKSYMTSSQVESREVSFVLVPWF